MKNLELVRPTQVARERIRRNIQGKMPKFCASQFMTVPSKTTLIIAIRLNNTYRLQDAISSPMQTPEAAAVNSALHTSLVCIQMLSFL